MTTSLGAQSLQFLFMGHSYDWTDAEGDALDSRIMSLNLDKYDGFWFGGDICANTSLDPNTWKRLDETFDLKNPRTHIALGNHDYRDDNLHLYYGVTGKADFYTSNIHSIVVSVINTNLNASDCQSLDKQYQMLSTVTDSISEASHYILMMHHQIFSDIPGLSDFKSNGNCEHYQLTCTGSSRKFEDSLYTKLIEVRNRGIEVIVLVGDSGWHKGGHWKSEHDIHFIASGINNSYYKAKAPELLKAVEKDKVLEFEFHVERQELEWRFIELGGWE